MMKAPKTLATLLGAAGAVYAVSFWAMVTVDPVSAWSRFEALDASGATSRAVGHGDQAIALRLDVGDGGEDVQAMQLRTANAHYLAGDPLRAIALYEEVLVSPLGSRLSDAERINLKGRIATLSLANGRPIEAAAIIGEFVDLAGDGAANSDTVEEGSRTSVLLQHADEAMDAFTDALPPITDREVITGDDRSRIATAKRLTDLGGYYARSPDGHYAAAGLLAASYKTRFDVLGPDHEDTVLTALLLAPVYERIGRISDAEKVYLSAFHAQEKAKGSNSPELSLYIRLLSDVYRRQGRLTEAEALNVHMRTLFRDAFGARRYASNQERDRTADVNRPVSPDFPLPADYIPPDLIDAEKFSIPLSKPSGIDEMRIRAAILDTETTMPKMLADLIGACQSDEERLSLRSGYRSYETQVALYGRADNGGKVARPGTSEHQSGLAVDIDVNGRFMRSTDRAYQCFSEQAWRYGFVLSFPQGNRYLDAEDGFEPWHWRFVGPRTALLYRETGPMGYPQEFLAALPCYEERALAGLFLSAGERDICLERVLATTVASTSAGADSGG